MKEKKGRSSHYGRLISAIGADRERTRNRPWVYIQLTKEERKGRTPIEMDELRKIKWGRDERNAPPTLIDTKPDVVEKCASCGCDVKNGAHPATLDGETVGVLCDSCFDISQLTQEDK